MENIFFVMTLTFLGALKLFGDLIAAFNGTCGLANLLFLIGRNSDLNR